MASDEGVLRAQLNPDKQPGDKRPAFQGTLTLPNEGAKRDVVLWARKDRNGVAMLTGKAQSSALEQIQALVEPPTELPVDAPLTDGKQFAIDPYQIMLFTTKEKVPNGPDFWGLYHPGPNAPLMHVAVWAKTDRDGKALLTGNIKVHKDAPERAPNKAKTRTRDRGR